MNLHSIDLNLAVTLDALLRERSVTKAAESLNLSQPTVSSSLARLRRHFDDELLERRGNHYELTPLGAQLAELAPRALAGLRDVFDPAGRFDPASARRTFRIISSDYGVVAGLRELSVYCAEHAPGIALKIEPMTPQVVNDPEDMLRKVDGLMLPHGVIESFPHVDVTTDRWVCVVSENNRRVGERLTVEDMSELPWVVVFTESVASSPVAGHLRALGLQMRMQAIVSNFSSVPPLVAGTERVAVMQLRLATAVGAAWNLRVVDPPFASALLIEAFWWHPYYNNDPGHRWLRQTLAAVNTKDCPPH